VLGEVNDTERNLQGKDLSSIDKVLRYSKHTNVFLTDVPPRCDSGKIPHINEEIMNYHTKLHEETNRFKNAQLLKTITNRELFTRHGLRMKKKGSK
jgi:hypothetical protein